MPEAEFEMYLSMLSRLVRLNPEQRSAIADELRDHLEARLIELISAGHSREEAVRMALDDFGDAASLAGDFRKATILKQRRKVMRYSLASVAGLVVTLFLVSAFWPVTRDLAPAPLGAQNVPGPRTLVKSSNESEVKPIAKVTPISAVEQRLDSKLGVAIKLEKVKFPDAIAQLRKITEVEILMGHLEDPDETESRLVTLELTAGKHTLRTALELLVEQLPGSRVDYVIRDQLVLVTTDPYVDVYDCRDLLASFPEPAKQSAPFVHTPDVKPNGFGDGSRVVTLGGRKITEVIKGIVVTDSWSENGGNGTIQEFNGLITVNQFPRVHRKLRGLLKLMRERLKERRELGAIPGNEQAVSEAAEKERGCEPGGKAPLLCLDTPPSVDEVIRALPEDVARNNVRIVMEPIVDKLESCRVYPLVGPARLHKVHYKCTVYFDKVAPQGKPILAARTDQGREVVYIDHDHLIRCASLTAGEK